MLLRCVSRFAAALVAVLVVASVVVVLPAAPPVEAAVHNVFPADADGFPKGRFRADEALFVTLTSDTTGGTVCVVDASVTNPATANCKSPRWGSPNRYVGIGTLLGYPLEAPLLPVGTWKLLAANPDGTVGNELSEPFEVVSCSPTCNTSAAASQLAPWKAAAAKQIPTAAGEARALVIDIATRTYKIASGLYAGLGFGIGWAMVGGAWAAADFDFVVPSTEDLAKAIHKQLSETVRAMYGDIAADPPDHDYGTVAPPELTTLDPTGDALVDDYLDTLMRVAAFGKASRVANERYQGAVIDGAHQAAATQAQATTDFTFDLNTELRRLQVLQPQVADRAWAREPIVAAPVGQDPVTWWNSMLAQLPGLDASDLTSADRQFLLDHGITSQQIDEAVARWADPAWRAEMQAIDPTQTLGDVLDDDVALLVDTIESFDAFGRWMALNAADELAQVPGETNRPPASAFGATALTGTAPLTATFTSQATDPDGDALALRWDIAGIRTVDGSTSVTQTFTNPGTYGISLVATDPDGEWDQAVKWVTVYPDSTGPEPGNRPPVAQFTPKLVDREGPFTQTFTSASYDPDGDSLTHTWYFGDGTTQTGATVTKTFPAGYIMSVLLVVSDGHLTGQASGEVTSRTAGGTPTGSPPAASFTATPPSGTAPLTVAFASTSTDPDGDALTHTWYFGDGASATGPTANHAYGTAGTYQATLVVSDGTHSRSVTKTITATAVVPLDAAYSVGRGYDAAAALSGARMLDTGVPSNPSYPVSNLIAPNANPWITPTGTTGEQVILVRLAGDGRDLLDHVVLDGPGSAQSVKTFSVALSSGSDPFGAYDTVIDHATLDRVATPQTFSFAARTARYLRLTVHDNHGGTTIRLESMQAPTADREGGIVSLGAGPPASVTSATSTFSASYAASNILRPDNALWRSASGQTTDQRIRVRLGGEGTHRIGTIVLRSPNDTSKAKDVKVFASATGADGDWTEVLSTALANNATAQSFPIASLPEARYVEVRLLNAHATPQYLGLAELRVTTPEGLNVTNPDGVGAQVVDVSSEADAAANAIAPDSNTSRWSTAPNGPAGQYLTVLLRDGRLATVDRVSIAATNNRPGTVRILVSTDGTTFTTVASRKLLNVSGEQFVTFPPVAARFVKVAVDDGYVSGNLWINKFRVYAIDRGGPEAVPFVDRSAGSAASWHWDFGDGTTSTAQHPVHTFPGAGTYPVTLTVTGPGGQTDTTTGSYTVPGTPVLSLTSTAPTEPDGSFGTTEAALVSFTASSDPTPSTKWEWDLDYTQPTATTASVNARFPDQGTYTVRYRGFTSDGVWTPWASRTVTVRNVAPTVNAGAPVSGFAGRPITPAVAAISDPADPMTCSWDWDDGSAATTVSPCTTASSRAPHTYAAAGTYTATLTVTDGDGGTTSSTVVLTAAHSPVIVHVTRAARSGADLDTTVRLLDAIDGSPISGQVLHVSADPAPSPDVRTSAAPVDGTTDANGEVDLTIQGARSAIDLTASFDGTTRWEARSLTRLVRAPKADIVFLVDESSSMGGNHAAVIANLQGLVQGLGGSLDYRVGTIGYGSGANSGFGTVRGALTDDVTAIYQGFDALTLSSNSANGYEAAVAGAGFSYRNGTLTEPNTVGLRAGSAKCAVLITDAPVGEADGLIASTNPNVPKATFAIALDALQRRHMTLFSMIPAAKATQDAYGPGPGLAGQTGGQSWTISAFAQDPSGVLEALVERCTAKAETPDLSVAVAGPTTPVAPGDSFDYVVTATNEAAIDTPAVVRSVTLPDEVAFESATGGGTYDAATRTVTWPEVDLEAGLSASASVTVRVRADGWPIGDTPVTANAAVTYDGSLGDESDAANNQADALVTVQVPDPTSTTTSTTTTTEPPTTTTTTEPPTSTTSTTTSTTEPPTTTSTTDPPTTTTSTTQPSSSSTTSTTSTTEPPFTTSTSETATTSTTSTTAVGSTTAPAVVSPASGSNGPGAPPQVSDGTLPRTGPAFPVGRLVAIAATLLVLGALLVRRRRTVSAR